MDDVSTISVVDPVAFAAALSLEGDGKEQVRSKHLAMVLSIVGNVLLPP